MSLFGNFAGGHTTIRQYQLIFSPREFSSYFKFTTVRNPWDRLLSAFVFLKNGGTNERDARWAREHLSAYDDFEAFVHGWLSRANIAKARYHLRAQRDFICVGRGSPLVDFIAYFENLKSDFTYICERLHMDSQLLTLNDGPARAKYYTEHYSDAMMRKVAEVYADDIRMLGYSFDNSSLSLQLARRRH
jgi:hypothetical protein